VTATAEETRFQDEPALRLTSGRVSATFVPGLGMTGVSLRNGGAEHLALPGGLDALRHGRTTGLPLLAPWANRLSSRVYRVGRIRVDMHGLRLGVDEHRLPIHGLLVGSKGWSVDHLATRGATARARASIEVDAKAFPFAHRIDVTASVRENGLTIDTSITPSGRRAVPLAFGWHPYLQLPGVARSSWNLRLPSRRHLLLDARGIPDGDEAREAAEQAPIARRKFDDLYALGRDRKLSFSATGGRRVELHCQSGYPYAQVWVPPGKTFAALEPMAAPTNALVDGRAPLVPPGETFTATFTLAVS
jgi:galactose mutarotase-like enzyme